MTGRREQQKADRQRRILAAARRQFRRSGYRATTVEAIAEDAGVSAMTVFNHYGSKGGLLLALVAESDRQLMTKIERLLAAAHDDAAAAVVAFSRTIIDHAFSYLTRATWGHVLATALVEGDSDFGRGYRALDEQLAHRLALLLARLKGAGQLQADCDESVAAEVLYNIHNARFVQYAADPKLSRERVKALVARDLRFVLARLLRSG